MIRFVLLIVVCAVGVIIAIPVKMIMDAMMAGIDTSGWNTLAAALIGLAPVVFFIWKAFVNPARRYLDGGDPRDEVDR